MWLSFKVMRSGKGREEFGPDLKWVGHRVGNIAKGKNDASPGPRVSHIDVVGAEYPLWC